MYSSPIGPFHQSHNAPEKIPEHWWLGCCFWHQCLVESPINGASDWHGVWWHEGLHYRRVPDKGCSLMKPDAMEYGKMMLFPAQIMAMGEGGGVLRKFFMGVVRSGFWHPTLGYRDRGPKSYPWLRKMDQNQTLYNRKCQQINHFCSNFAWNWSNLAQILPFVSNKNRGIRSKWPKFASNIPLATEPQPKIDPLPPIPHFGLKSTQSCYSV